MVQGSTGLRVSLMLQTGDSLDCSVAIMGGTMTERPAEFNAGCWSSSLSLFSERKLKLEPNGFKNLLARRKIFPQNYPAQA
jgi:hypothetical protein